MNSKPKIVNLEPGPAIAIRAQLGLAELPKFFGTAFSELTTCGADQIAGPPFAVYHSLDKEQIDVEAVMPLRAPIAPHGRVKPIALTGGPAIQVRHVGSDQELGTAYNAIEQWIEDHHRSKAAPMREVYLSEPTVPIAKHVTLVIQPLQSS